MKTARPHRAILVAVLLVLPALTSACAFTGRDGAHEDQVALQKALSSVAVPKGLTATDGPSLASTAGPELACELNLDCSDIGSTIWYAPVKGNLQACTAAIALQGTVPADTVRWKGMDYNPTHDATWAQGALAGVSTLRPNPAEMTAACVRALSSKQTFMVLSDLKPNAVPVKSAQALVSVAYSVEDKPQPLITLTYDGPSF